jgi:hypothetical protein
MNSKFLVLTAAMLAGSATMLIAPQVPSASAQSARDERACLQNNHIYGWTVVNERALVVNDRYGMRFSVNLSSGCVGLTNATFALRFITTTDLGCLRRGDRIGFEAPALGPMSCFVTDVQPLAGRARGGYFGRPDEPNDGRDGFGGRDGFPDRGNYLNR